MGGVGAFGEVDGLGGGGYVDAGFALRAELLTNAHTHTTGPYALRIRSMEPDRFMVAVWDTGPRVPDAFKEGPP